MFMTKQTPPPLPPPEPNGIEIKVRLSEATLLKLIPLAVAVLVGSGVLAHTQLVSPPNDSPANTVEVTP